MGRGTIARNFTSHRWLMFSHLFKLRDYLVHERKVVTNMAIVSRQNRWIVLGSQIKTFANYSDRYNIIERRPSIFVRQGLTQRGKPTERHSTHWPHVYIAHQSSVPSPPSLLLSFSQCRMFERVVQVYSHLHRRMRDASTVRWLVDWRPFAAKLDHAVDGFVHDWAQQWVKPRC